MSDDREDGPVVVVPWTAVAAETLTALIEEFVTRDGTDYGASEVPLAQKVAQVRTQLQRNEVVIVVDTLAESVTLLTRADWAERQRRDASADPAQSA